jgi:hypothetical protein
MAEAALSADVEEAITAVGRVDLAVGVLTYNNAETVKAVVASAAQGLAGHLPGVTAALVNVDAESSDGTRDLLVAAGLPVLATRHDSPITERSSVPFHGIPGRGAALRTLFSAAQRLGVRALVMLEADAAAPMPEWVARLAGPILQSKVDFVTPAYARHRYEGTITKLVLSPLVRALYGRRLRQPFGGQQAFSSRLLEHLLGHPKWDWRGRDASDLWIVGTTIADGFSVWEAWLGPHTVRSRTRTADLPAMVAQTLGAAFTVMDRHEDLWLEVRGSEAMPAVGPPAPASIEPMEVDVARMVDGFRLGVRDLTSIWELILAPETLGDVLSLDVTDVAHFRFPDDLWARTVYDFALGHHYAVVHREHLLRSLVPLYLGRTAAFVIGTQRASAAASEAAIEAVGASFERQKPYLVERWR